MKDTVITAGKSSQVFSELKSALLPGTVAGIMVLIMSVSFAALIFRGPLAPFLQNGIAMTVSCALLAGLVMTIFSRCHPIIIMSDEDTAPVLALLAAAIYATLGPETDPTTIFRTIALGLICTTLITGIGLALVGYLGIGELIQYLPHSVMGGYFCSLGWLLVVGASGIGGVTGATSASWLSIEAIAQWLPALLLAAWLILMRNQIPRSLLLPLSALTATLLWYAANYWVDISPRQALEAGYLIGPFSRGEGGILNTASLLYISPIEWFPLLSNLGSIASILLISAMSLLLTVNGIAGIQKTDPDMNRELIVSGVANIASGAGGGIIGMPSYSLSSIAIESGAETNRWTGFTALAVCLLFFSFGLPLLAYIPRSIVAGLLLFVGASLIDEWLIKGRKKFPPLEYLVIPIILGVSITLGFLESILVGLIGAIILFVIKYSQNSAIRYFGTGAEFMSNVDRDDRQQNFLRENGRKILIVSLEGYLFFGSARGVYQRIFEHLEHYGLEELSFLIIDFSRVSGMDTSASMNFQKLGQLADERGAKVLLCAVSDTLLERFSQLGEGDTIFQPSPQIFPDLDRGMEWSEEAILNAAQDLRAAMGCFDQMHAFISPDAVFTLKSYLQRRDVGKGDILTRQGEQATELYFLESCSASAYITTSTGDTRRVRRSDRGTIFGELAFYLNIARTASVVMDEAGIIYVLSQTELTRMEEQDPEVAAGLNRYMARLLSERLMFTTKTLRAVSA